MQIVCSKTTTKEVGKKAEKDTLLDIQKLQKGIWYK